MALATGEQALSRPLESNAVTAAKYRAPAKSPVTLYVMVSLGRGLLVGDAIWKKADPEHGVLAVPK
jgi:hypothetical protein